MNITAILPYFGGKRTLAGKIVEALGPHTVYWEPFCGSLAVLLSKPAVRMETAVDLYGDLVNLARVLQARDAAEAMYAALYPMVPCNALHREAKERLAGRADRPAGTPPDVERAVDFFVCSWLGRNGCIGTKQFNNNFCVRYTSNGGATAHRWRSAVGSIPDWHERLKGVVVLEADGIAVCERVEDKAGTAIYADPPYLSKGASYVHDFDADDHRRLAEALRRFTRTRVVVSYYAHPRLADLYHGWRVIELASTKALANQGRAAAARGAVSAPEVLLVNQPD